MRGHFLATLIAAGITRIDKGCPLLVAGSTCASSLTINLENLVAASYDAYVSFNIDAADLSTDFDWTSPRLASLAAQLAPALLRIGGGAQKNVQYDDAFFDGPW